MDIELLLSIFIILSCSFIQSIFGTGLLVFGTPLFLLLGANFNETLSYILPSSLLLSILQVYDGKEHLKGFKISFFIYAIPPLIPLLFLVLNSDKNFNISIYIGGALLLYGISRIFANIQKKLTVIVEKYDKCFLIFMGAIHGATNMGGALLNMYVNSLFHTKEAIRVHIAYAYTVFVAIQLLTLFFVGFETHNSGKIILFPCIAISTFMFIGNKFFRYSSQEFYKKLMTILILSLGLLLIIKS